MLKNQFALVLVGITMTLGFAVKGADNPAYRRGDRIHTNNASVRVGGDNVVFGYEVTGCDETSLKDAARSLKTRSTSDRGDDKWYAFSVPRSSCLMFGFYDLTARKFGWAAVQNQPNTWKARGSNTGWGNLSNGSQAKYSFNINGQRIDLDVFNPNNVNALNGDDILISFGF